jgi:anaerobic selenocysteine-containing dehydrogenase
MARSDRSPTCSAANPVIVAQLAEALGCAPSVPWHALTDDYAVLRERIEHCQRGVTAGFHDYNARLVADGRFVLPNSAAERIWHTASGKAQFQVHPLRDDDLVALARQRHGDATLTLMTLRAHDQFNTTVYSQDDRYRNVFGDRRVIFLNAIDLAARGLRDGDRVDIETLVDDGQERRLSNFTARAWDIPSGCAAAYYPEASGLIAASSFSSGTHTPLYKEMPVRVSARARAVDAPA